MYMNLKHNQHKIIYFNTATMTSLGFKVPPLHPPPPPKLPAKFNFFIQTLKLGYQKATLVLVHTS